MCSGGCEGSRAPALISGNWPCLNHGRGVAASHLTNACARRIFDGLLLTRDEVDPHQNLNRQQRSWTPAERPRRDSPIDARGVRRLALDDARSPRFRGCSQGGASERPCTQCKILGTRAVERCTDTQA